MSPRTLAVAILTARTKAELVAVRRYAGTWNDELQQLALLTNRRLGGIYTRTTK